jgi:hypothetical protein
MGSLSRERFSPPARSGQSLGWSHSSETAGWRCRCATDVDTGFRDPAPCEGCKGAAACGLQRLVCNAFASFSGGAPATRWRLAYQIASRASSGNCSGPTAAGQSCLALTRMTLCSRQATGYSPGSLRIAATGIVSIRSQVSPCVCLWSKTRRTDTRCPRSIITRANFR